MTNKKIDNSATANSASSSVAIPSKATTTTNLSVVEDNKEVQLTNNGPTEIETIDAPIYDMNNCIVDPKLAMIRNDSSDIEIEDLDLIRTIG